MLNIQKIQSDFPILQEKVNGYNLVYLDNAATTQKPQIVIDTLVEYYSKYNSNVHRGVHMLSQTATEKYEEARDKIKDFIGAESREEIVFTKNDTESLNLVALSYGMANLKENDEIIISVAEHHSNIVPWQNVARQTGAQISFVALKKDYSFDYDQYFSLLNSKTKIVSLSHGSNVTGEILNLEKIVSAAHKVGAVVMIDAGQTIAHKIVAVKNVDFLTFSSHKLYGPTGVGVLYGKKNLLEKMEPVLGGGDMIKEVFEEYSTWNDLPYKFEAGTPNIADVIALGAAIDYLNKINTQDLQDYEKNLEIYALEKLKKLDFVEIYHVISDPFSLPIISFNVKNIHPHDAGSILDQYGIAIRTGHHCAQPLMKHLNQVATCRASMALYNTREDIDKLIEGLNKVKEKFAI